MRDELLSHYERELTFLRQLGVEFAQKYPKIASRLQLEPNRCEDPHVERLIEAFSFLAARIQLKLEDEFPEITHSLLDAVYPHYTRPVPSMSIAEFQLDPEQGRATSGIPVARGSVLYSRTVGGFSCKFRTCYDATLWPLSVTAAQWRTPDRLEPAIKATDAVAAIRLELQTAPGIRFNDLAMPSLRFYLNGDNNLVHPLYELLSNGCTQILLRDPSPKSRQRPMVLPPDALRPLGFAEDEGMLPYSRRSFLGYRLLQEYFAFPEKFLFLDLSGLEALSGSGFKEQLEIVFLLAPFERSDWEPVLQGTLSEKAFRLGCAPVINLFEHTAEPILVDRKRYEYRVVPDVRQQDSIEVFSIDEVLSTRPDSREVLRFEPFYSRRHRSGSGPRAYWHASQRPSDSRLEDGAQLWLSLIDRSGRPLEPDFDIVTLRCTCSNRDLPSRLPFGNENGDFEMDAASSIKRIVALRKPTGVLRATAGKASLWRLVSQLSLNYLSLVEDGKESLQEILRLYDFSSAAHFERQIAGIESLSSRRHFARVVSESGISFVRGTRVEMELNEEEFVGGGVYLFSSVLEQFLGLYASLNSFSQLVVKTKQRKEVLKQWPPRAGQSILL